MYSYPTPIPEFTAQFQPQESLHNKPVSNNPWAVQGGLSAINTNVCLPQYGYTSESPLPMSSSTNSYPSYDIALLSQPSFGGHPSFSDASEWSYHRPQPGSSSQALVPANRNEANKVFIRRLGWLWLFLKARSKLRNLGRRHQRRHSASDCTSRTAGYNNASYFSSSLSVPHADDVVLDGLVTGDQANLCNSIDPTNPLWIDNTLGIITSDGNSLFPVAADFPRQATVLYEEDVAPPIQVQRPVECLDEVVSPGDLMNPTQQEVIVPGPSKKRSLDCVELDDSSTDEAEGKSVGKKRPKTSPTPPRFACPFYKHDPERYETSRSCCGPGWESVHRVKEHIFRSHMLPEHECQRCFLSFKTELALSRHMRAPVPCEVQSRSTQEKEGISATQLKALRVRAKKCDKADTKEVEEERWNTAYKIIFPDEGKVPSPYYDHLQKSSNNDFDAKLMADFEQRMQGKLGDMKNLQSTLAPLIAQAARNALMESLQSCRQGLQDDSSQLAKSRMAVPRHEESQSFLAAGSQMMGLNDNFLRRRDGQLFVQALRDSGLEFGPTGFFKQVKLRNSTRRRKNFGDPEENDNSGLPMNYTTKEKETLTITEQEGESESDPEPAKHIIQQSQEIDTLRPVPSTKHQHFFGTSYDNATRPPGGVSIESGCFCLTGFGSENRQTFYIDRSTWPVSTPA
ncbi:hypothetical protein FBEOM_2678 [Fusarium beomiforme]|uniref:C2H2-type domain-containing protein n=1 Tax=Fusarium beomiforme TaxID=44412 RepID=A0A9P5AR25_9HYPO|nr:hypothetical protein FBEOM_2678 [Fusarium beomiforme]